MSRNQVSDITELYSPLAPRRLLFDYGMNAIAFTFTGLALIPLLSLLWKIVGEGIATLISVPCGVMTGIFLSEISPRSHIGRAVRFITSILTGVPSIVVGIFAYGVIVLVTKHFSAIAGGFALAVIMLPIVVLTTEEALKLVPQSLRLGSAALGGTRFQTTFRVVVAAAIPAITTGILLAVARAAGETAPLIFTSLFSLDWSQDFLGPTASLSVLIFNFYNDPSPEKTHLIWTASLILVGMVLLINLLSRLLTNKRK